MLISIVYDSGYGHTARQARAVSEGVGRLPDAEERLVAIADGRVPWQQLEASDAIIFGAPTYNGSPSARFQPFYEGSTKPAWIGMKWRDKVAAGFINYRLHSLILMALFRRPARHGAGGARSSTRQRLQPRQRERHQPAGQLAGRDDALQRRPGARRDADPERSRYGGLPGLASRPDRPPPAPGLNSFSLD